MGSSRILIAGCGAIGSVFACLLRKAGYEVTLLGRRRHLDAIRSARLEVDGIWGHHRAEGFELATEATQLLPPYDLIIISVKAYDTQQLIDQLAPCLHPKGRALSLQNGLGNVELLASVFGAARSLGASVLVGAKIPELGKATVTVQAAPTIFGPLDASAGEFMEKCRSWARGFNQARIPSETTDQILSHLWAKVFYNAPLNPLGALLQVHYGALGEEADLVSIMDQIIDEAFRVAERKGVRLLWNKVDEYRRYFYSHLLPSTYDHQSSMLQDLERGRRTEIDALNGKIWRYGEELGIPTPFNETMTRLVWGREKQLEHHGPASHTGHDLGP